MTLIVEPDPPYVRWCSIASGTRVEHAHEFGPGWMSAVLNESERGERIEAVGYLLYHGGEIIKEPVTRLSPPVLDALEQAVAFLPEHNGMTSNIARQLTTRLSDTPHFLFCDTAFFSDLPPEASTYAVPYALREQGIRRYGGYGLFHQFAWERAQDLLTPRPVKLVSVYLGNHTNVAAISGGKVVETSIGFTPVEGTISVNSCGDIDPTIVFQLIAAGMTLSEINRTLTQESGFSGILNRPCTFKEIVTGTVEPGMTFVREKLLYDLNRYIGAFAAALGGLDALVVLADDIEESLGFVASVCDSLKFLGLKPSDSVKESEGWRILTEPDSPIQALCVKANTWNIINQTMIILTNKEKSQ